MKKLTVNVFLNVIRSLMGILFPLITYPYVSRVLQAENIGKVNYAASIVSYFLLFAMLGITVYATREGAQIRDNRLKLNTFVSEIYSINLLTATLSMICLFIVAVLIKDFNEYKYIILLLSLEIPLSALGTDWINSIFEDYTYITIRTIGFQLIALILMFILVRDRQDYMQYAFCTLISGYGAGLINMIYTRRFCSKHVTFKLNLKKHIKPIFLLFATNLASLIYSNSDITMLGMITSDYNVGIYSTASKVYNIFKHILFSIVVVCLPRFSNILANNGRRKYEYYARKVYQLVFILSVPLMVGIFLLSDSIIDIIAGSGYYDAIPTLKILCFAVFFAILGYFNMQLVLLPSKKDKDILFSTIVAAIINVVANLFLIPLLLENGAALTTVFAELIVFIITKYKIRNLIDLRVEKKIFFQTILSSIIMFIMVMITGRFFQNSFIRLIICFAVGGVTYLLSMTLLKNEFVMNFIHKAKFKFKNRI